MFVRDILFSFCLSQRYGLWDQEEQKSNLSSVEKNKKERDEKVFQLSDEEDSRAQPEPDTEVLSMTPSTESPTEAEIQTDPEPNIQTNTTETLDTAKEDGKKKSRFLRFRKKKHLEKGLLEKKKIIDSIQLYI